MLHALINESVQHLLQDPERTEPFKGPKQVNSGPIYGDLGDPQWR